MSDLPICRKLKDLTRCGDALSGEAADLIEALVKTAKAVANSDFAAFAEDEGREVPELDGLREAICRAEADQ